MSRAIQSNLQSYAVDTGTGKIFDDGVGQDDGVVGRPLNEAATQRIAFRVIEYHGGRRG